MKKVVDHFLAATLLLSCSVLAVTEKCELLKFAAAVPGWPAVPVEPQHLWREITMCFPEAHSLGSSGARKSVRISVLTTPAAETRALSPFLTVRVIGPSLAACTLLKTELPAAGQASTATKLVYACPVSGVGQYFVSALMEYEDAADAWHGPPKCSTWCLCRELVAANSGSRPSFDVMSGISLRSISQKNGVGFAGWVLRDDSAATAHSTHVPTDHAEFLRPWVYVHNRHPQDNSPAPMPSSTCLQQSTVIIAGDSHQRHLTEYFRSSGLRNVHYLAGRGFDNHAIPPSLLNSTCEKPAAWLAKNSGAYGGILGLVQQAAALARKSNHARVYLIFESGHWDLRDEHVEDTYFALAEMLELLDKLAHMPNTTVVWRTAPPFSYRRSAYQAEHRSNLKLMQLAEFAQRYIGQHSLRVSVHDTFNIIYPVFEHTCDTTHYLCSGNNDSPAGIADAEALMSMLCNLPQ